jgi:hypothetical protein
MVVAAANLCVVFRAREGLGSGVRLKRPPPEKISGMEPNHLRLNEYE